MRLGRRALVNAVRTQFERGASAGTVTLWRDDGYPEAALRSPRELVLRDPAQLLRRAQLPDESNMHHLGPQTKVLEAAGRDRLYELALADDTALPASSDRERYLGHDDIGYWLFGMGDALWLLDVAAARNVELDEDSVILDFGCSSGRVMRHLPSLAPGVGIRGVELSTKCVRWGRQHLPPTLPILQGTVLPDLPFPDCHFDLIYAGSVLTHIDAFEEAWLEELRRVLKPGGIAVVSFHPERLWAEMASDPAHFLRERFLCANTRLDPPGVAPLGETTFASPIPGSRLVFTDMDASGYNVDIVHSHDWVRSRWGQWFEIEEIVRHGHGNHQDAMIGRRRS